LIILKKNEGIIVILTKTHSKDKKLKKIVKKLFANSMLSKFELNILKINIKNYIEFRSFAATKGHLMTHELQMQRNNINKLTQTELMRFLEDLCAVGIKPFYNL
jgi:hypothetical protein